VKEHEQAPPETVLCGRCAALCDPDDNFCRKCGFPFAEQHLPSIRNGHLPAVWRPPVPAAVVKGVAFIALGTLGEAFLRRLARRVFSGDTAAQPARRSGNANVVATGDPEADGQIMSETLLLRHIRVRR
jgi:hypothetical protein